MESRVAIVGKGTFVNDVTPILRLFDPLHPFSATHLCPIPYALVSQYALPLLSLITQCNFLKARHNELSHESITLHNHELM